MAIDTGAFYAFIQKGLGRSVGLGSATLAVVSYALILVALQGYIGYAAAGAVNGFFNIALPWWVYSFLAVAVIAYLGYRDIELSSKFLGIALVLEIAVVVLVDNAKTVSLFVVLFLVATFAFGVWIAEHFRARHPTRYETLRQLA